MPQKADRLLSIILRWDCLRPSQRRRKFGRGYGIYEMQAARDELRELVGQDEFSALMRRHIRPRTLADLEPVVPETGVTRRRGDGNDR